MPARGLWVVQQTELARLLPLKDRGRAYFAILSLLPFYYIFRHGIYAYKLSHCNLKYLKCLTLSETLFNSFGKEREEILLNQNNKQTLRGKRCLYSGIKRPLMATENAVHELFVASFLSTFPHDILLLILGFDMSKSFKSSCEKPI